MRKDAILAFSIIVAVLLGFGIWTFLGGNGDLTNSSSSTGDLPAPGLRLNSAKDGIVYIAEARLETAGFIVIYHDNGQSSPGRTAGASKYLAGGDYTNLQIAVPQMESGKRYFAMILYDDLDGKLSLKNDIIARYQKQPVIASIVAN